MPHHHHIPTTHWQMRAMTSHWTLTASTYHFSLCHSEQLLAILGVHQAASSAAHSQQHSTGLRDSQWYVTSSLLSCVKSKHVSTTHKVWHQVHSHNKFILIRHNDIIWEQCFVFQAQGDARITVSGTYSIQKQNLMPDSALLGLYLHHSFKWYSAMAHESCHGPDVWSNAALFQLIELEGLYMYVLRDCLFQNSDHSCNLSCALICSTCVCILCMTSACVKSEPYIFVFEKLSCWWLQQPVAQSNKA